MSNIIRIVTPRATIQTVRTGEASLKTTIDWNPSFGREWTTHLQRVQGMFDMEVLRRTEPYVPFDTGTLAHSAIMASHIGEGLLVWNTPYARAQYYGTADHRAYDLLRGGHWGERMKADNAAALEGFLKRAVGAK